MHNLFLGCIKDLHVLLVFLLAYRAKELSGVGYIFNTEKPRIVALAQLEAVAQIEAQRILVNNE